ncbi:MAG: MmcB family DNA repair protein [Phyllobacteriaceae bacterium]|nr:MmcB family DNA repair protein [Phyllobacteriaceae bacterium]
MPIIDPFARHPLADGRQSERALLVRHGVLRLFQRDGLAVVPELTLATGRRADLVAVSRKGEILIVEVKSSIEDFRVDRKWPEYRAFCDRLYFATHPHVPADIFPEDAGFLLSDGYGAELLREAPEHRLAPHVRKAMMLAFSRAAAFRLTAAELAGVGLKPVEGEEA